MAIHLMTLSIGTIDFSHIEELALLLLLKLAIST
jgi:hypothetical protein